MLQMKSSWPRISFSRCWLYRENLFNVEEECTSKKVVCLLTSESRICAVLDYGCTSTDVGKLLFTVIIWKVIKLESNKIIKFSTLG